MLITSPCILSLSYGYSLLYSTERLFLVITEARETLHRPPRCIDIVMLQGHQKQIISHLLASFIEELSLAFLRPN